MTQALFANQREGNLQSTVALIEAVLGDLGHDPAVARIAPIDDSLHAWRIIKGSATTLVTLVNRTLFTHLRVCSVVLTLDDKVDRAALHAHLLGLNARLCGAAFATDDDRVLMVAERTTLDLDKSEVRELVRRVTTYADDHDDQLVAAFGGRLGGVA